MIDVKDFSWSYSAYSKAHECLACFKRGYLDGEPQPGAESGDLLFGSAMHSAWNALLSGEDYEAVFETYWGMYKERRDIEYGRFKWAELHDMGHKFLSKFNRFHAKRFSLDKSEIRLHGEYNGVKLNGQFDFLGTLDGKYSLLDLKTSARNYEKEKEHVALQLNLYAYLALRNGLKYPDHLGYVVLNKGTGSIQEPLVWDFKEDKMYSMLDDMTNYCKLIAKADTFPKNPNAFRHNFNCFKPEVSE